MNRALLALTAVAFLAVGAVAVAQTPPPAGTDVALAEIQIARDALSRAEAALAAAPPTTAPTTAPATTAPTPVSAWTEPPVVSVPVLTPGTRPVIPVPGTDTRLRFTADVLARPVGTMQLAYEHATATGQARPNDPLVTPGDGSHAHDFAGTILTDTANLATIHEFAPVVDPGSKIAQYGSGHWLNGIGHQPGVWHPTVFFRDGPQVTIGAGSALNYVRDPAAHLDTDRLFLLPNGCGWVSPINRYHHTGDGKWRITFEGPTWARKSLLTCGPLATPEANHDAFWFARSRPPWADEDGIPLAIVSWYFKSGDLKLTEHPTPPPLSFGGPNTGILPHMDYVSASSPLPALGNIQLAQWILDMTVNAELFGGDSPLYGRFQIEPQP